MISHFGVSKKHVRASGYSLRTLPACGTVEKKTERKVPFLFQMCLMSPRKVSHWTRHRPRRVSDFSYNSWISHDVTAAMLVSQNNEMAAMLVSRSNPPGIESYYYANVFFCFRWKTWLLITWVKPKNWLCLIVRASGYSLQTLPACGNVKKNWKQRSFPFSDVPHVSTKGEPLPTTGKWFQLQLIMLNFRQLRNKPVRASG